LLSPNDPVLSTKFVRFKVKEDTWFYAYDSYASKTFTSKTTTGIYSPIELDSEFELKAYKKDWFDFILRKNKMKTGNRQADSKLTITCTENAIPQTLITKGEAEIFEKLEELVSPIFLLIEKDYILTIEELKDKMVVGLEVNGWIYKEIQIDNFIDPGTTLLNRLKRNARANDSI